MTRPLVSVVVPVYNVEAYIDVCLASVRGQTYPNLDIVLVEDCSTDGTVARLDAHLADERVRLIRHTTNGGLSKARNTGIEAARGEYVLFVDSDDVVAEGLVEACVDAATSTGADVVAFDCVPFQDGAPVDLAARALPRPEPIEGAGFFELPQFAWLKLIRVDLLTNPALRFPEGYYYEDGPFHWALGLQAETAVHLKVPLYGYRQRGSSITGSGGTKLFHIFASQLLIDESIQRHDSDTRATRLLAGKVYSSLWFIAMTIGDDLLGETMSAIRRHLDDTRAIRSHVRPSVKHAVLIGLLHLPSPLALTAIRSLRKAVEALSRDRHSAKRTWRSAPQSQVPISSPSHG